MGELLYTGKAKSIYKTNDPKFSIMEFRDDVSAFNGIKLEKLAEKGRINNQINAFVATKLAQAGIPTHFERVLTPNSSLVKTLQMLPLESVVRNFAAGGMVRRYGLKEGQPFNPPTLEYFLKSDKLDDPLLNDSLIETLELATVDQLATIRRLSLQANTVLVALFATAEITLVDFKLEFGIFDGEIVLGDEFSPDGCRLWDSQSQKKLDKDRFRQGLGDVVESYREVATRLGIELY